MAYYHFKCDRCEVMEVTEAKMIEASDLELKCQECDKKMRRLYKPPSIQYFGGGYTK